ncbi:hypothetical protein DSO57_1021591 [Entomophthora muscae]|uniref:Uncharacterized protein n=1 Tax=Entomophthora muscae TaxID=34485 RepID=A0ACC2TEJ3_9FUNG|nr:hypothetical protein DSO57_1021591 [Entomophthora muscae]
MHQVAHPGPSDDPTILDMEHICQFLNENGDVLTSTAINNTRRIKAYLIQFNHPMLTALVNQLEQQRIISEQTIMALNYLQDYSKTVENLLQDQLHQIQHEHVVLGALHLDIVIIVQQITEDHYSLQQKVIQPLVEEVAKEKSHSTQHDVDIGDIQTQLETSKKPVTDGLEMLCLESTRPKTTCVGFLSTSPQSVSWVIARDQLEGFVIL